MAEFDTETRDRLEGMYDATWDLLRHLSLLLDRPLPGLADEVAPPPESVPMRPGRSMDKDTAMRERAERKEREMLARAEAVAEENQHG